MITSLLLVNEKELVSVSAERLKEIEKLQEIITSLTLQVQEKDEQIEKLKQSLKGNSYYYIGVTFYCIYIIVKDLAFIPKARKPVNDQGLEEICTKPYQKEESTPETIGNDTFCNYSCIISTNVRGE